MGMKHVRYMPTTVASKHLIGIEHLMMNLAFSISLEKPVNFEISKICVPVWLYYKMREAKNKCSLPQAG